MVSKQRFLIVLFLLIAITGYSQHSERILFSTAIEKNIRISNKKSENAFFDNDMERVHFLFDSLVNHIIKGTYLDNFKVHKRSGRQIDLHKFKKPIFLITYSAWYPMGKGEVQAFNQIAKEHYKEIDFIALFWEPKRKARKASRDFSNKVHILYVDEKDNKYDNIVKSMKHSLGIPTAIFTDVNKIILDVGRLPAHNFNENIEVSYNSKYSYFRQGVTTILKAGAGKSDN